MPDKQQAGESPLEVIRDQNIDAYMGQLAKHTGTPMTVLVPAGHAAFIFPVGNSPIETRKPVDNLDR